MAEKFVDINNRDEFVDALADLLTSDICHTKHKKGCLAPTCRDCIDRFFEMCSHLLPAADVARVVHGKWLNSYNDFSCAECDRCRTIFEVTDNESDEGLWNAFKLSYGYCPNCGAKMDEEVKK